MTKNKVKYTDLYTYKMPELMAKEYLATRKNEDAKIHPKEYLKRIVNDNFDIKGYCIKVITF